MKHLQEVKEWLRFQSAALFETKNDSQTLYVIIIGQKWVFFVF